MPHHELKDNDVFHVIGFTRQDIVVETHMHLMKRMAGSAPSQDGRLVEVYSLDAVTAPDPAAFRLYGDYLAVYFYNETALALSKEYGLVLPRVLATVIRAELPLGASTSIRMPYPAVRGKSASN